MLYILAIIAVAFMLQFIFPQFTQLFYLDPAHPEQIWRLVTSIFLHSGFEHFFFNALSLFFFAPVLERTAGKKEFYKIFFSGGIVGGLLYLALIFAGFSPPVPALGASGAIYALLGAVAFFHPDSVVYIYLFPLKMKHAVVLWTVLNLGYIVDWASGIGGAAHLGGLFFGYFYAKYLQEHKGFGWVYH